MKRITLIDKAFLLKRTKLFEALDLDLLLAFADKLAIVTFEPGEEIFIEGQEGHRMYFIVKGNVLINGKIERELSSPQFFGEEALFNERPRAYSAKALNSATLLALTRTHMNTMIYEAPVIAMQFLHDFTTHFPNKFQKEDA